MFRMRSLRKLFGLVLVIGLVLSACGGAVANQVPAQATQPGAMNAPEIVTESLATVAPIETLVPASPPFFLMSYQPVVKGNPQEDWVVSPDCQIKSLIGESDERPGLVDCVVDGETLQFVFIAKAFPAGMVSAYWLSQSVYMEYAIETVDCSIVPSGNGFSEYTLTTFKNNESFTVQTKGDEATIEVDIPNILKSENVLLNGQALVMTSRPDIRFLEETSVTYCNGELIPRVLVFLLK